jgi:hypothetical protein
LDADAWDSLLQSKPEFAIYCNLKNIRPETGMKIILGQNNGTRALINSLSAGKRKKK